MRTKGFLPTLLFVGFTTAFATAQEYTITDLGPLTPTAINSWAQVVGNYNNQAYIWNRGHMKALGLLPGGTFSSAAGINDSGVVTGTADGLGTVIDPAGNQQCSGLVQPFLWEHNQLRGLGTVATPGEPGLDCYLFYLGTAINSSSNVVGTMPEGPSFYGYGFLWTKSTGITLFGGSWTPSSANGINSNGQIVGQNGVLFGVSYAASWQNGVATDLGALTNPPDLTTESSSANGVNDAGQIVGWSTASPISFLGACYDDPDLADCIVHAVLWTPEGVIQDLGTLPGDQYSIALKINSSGQIIGSSGNTLAIEPIPVLQFQSSLLEVTGRPFIWSARHGMHDLNTLIPSNGWVLNTATDINVWGQIVGEGELNGQPHGYLLTPKNPFQQR